MLLSRRPQQQILADFHTHGALVQYGKSFMVTKNVPKKKQAAEMSAWLSNVVMRAATLVGDTRWSFAYLIAQASNREWRDNVRAERSAVVGTDILHPHAESAMYWRATAKVKSKGIDQCVVLVNDETKEVIDMSLKHWQNESPFVETDKVGWCCMLDPSLPLIRGASWDYYRVVVTPLDDLCEFTCMSSKAVQTIHAVIDEISLVDRMLEAAEEDLPEE